MKGQTDTTVAIVAIIATALAGVIGPTIAGLFSLKRLKRDQREAQRMDRLAERRRLIYEALDQLAAVETKFSDHDVKGSAREFLDLTAAFLGHHMRLRAAFGPESDVAKAYQAAMKATLDVVQQGQTSGRDRDAIMAATEASREASERLVRVVEPYVEASRTT